MDELKNLILHGPINVTAYYIYKHIEAGEIQYAQTEWQNDGDKISSNSPYHKTIKAILGCRLHLNTKCDKHYCKH